jgi:hypothetical protein
MRQANFDRWVVVYDLFELVPVISDHCQLLVLVLLRQREVGKLQNCELAVQFLVFRVSISQVVSLLGQLCFESEQLLKVLLLINKLLMLDYHPI